MVRIFPNQINTPEIISQILITKDKNAILNDNMSIFNLNFNVPVGGYNITLGGCNIGSGKMLAWAFQSF